MMLLLALASRDAHAQVRPGSSGQAAAARQQVRSQPGLAGLDLEQRAVLRAGASTVVRFAQRHRGLPVLGAAVAVRLSPDGSVRRVVTGAWPVSVDTHPSVMAATAQARVAAAAKTGGAVVSPALAVLPDPLRGDGGRLVWQVTAPTMAGGERFLVDAHTGQIVGRRGLARDVLGRVYTQASSLVSALEDLPLPGLSMLTPMRLTSTDGQLAVYEYVGGGLKAGLAVKQSVGPTSSGDFIYDPPGSAQDASDAFSAVNAFYHAQRARFFFADTLGVDMSSPAWSLGVVVNVLDHGGPLNNSYFASHGLAERPNVIVLGQGVVDFAYDEDLLTHEFSHHVTHNAVDSNAGVFASDDRGWLTHSAGVDEGVADYFACTMRGDPVFGDTLPEAWRRDLSTAAPRCPDDLTGEPHADGAIVGSAAWSIREALGAARADQLVWGGAAMMTAVGSMQDFATGVLDTADDMVAAGSLSTGDAAQLRALLDQRGLLDCGRQLSLDHHDRTTGLLGLDTLARYKDTTCDQAASQLSMSPAFSFVYHPDAGASRIRLHAALASPSGEQRWSLLVRRDAPVSFHPSASGFPEPGEVDLALRDLTSPTADLDIGDDPGTPLGASAYHAVVLHTGCAPATLTVSASVLSSTSPAPSPQTTTPPGESPGEAVGTSTASGAACGVGRTGAGGWWVVGLLALAVARRRPPHPPLRCAKEGRRR